MVEPVHIFEGGVLDLVEVVLTRAGFRVVNGISRPLNWLLARVLAQ